MSLHNRKSLEPYIKDDVEFFKHQVDGVRRMWNMPSFLLADDMGLGKSVQALTVFGIHCQKMKQNYGADSTMLVVCPPTLKDNWVDEIEKFTGFNYVKLHGSPKVREEQMGQFIMMEGCKILIVNYEQIKPHLAQINSIGFDCVIADEAHKLKNPQSQRTKAFQNVRSDRSFMLTGSPLLNNVHELWVILDRIQPKQWGTYWGFCQKYCVYGGFGGKQIIGVKNEPHLVNALQHVMIRRLKSEVLDLPEVQIIPRIVDLTPLQRKLYDQAISDLVIETSATEKMELENPATKFLRLKQICGTTAALLESGEDSSAKLDLAIEDAEEICGKGNKLVVFTQFRSVHAAYVKRFQAAMPSVPLFELHGDVKQELRQGIVKEWGATSGPAVIVCMLQVASIGLNMTAARYCQFIDKDFVPALNQQAIDRLNRIGASTTQAVQVLEYRARGTVETRVESILKVKKNIFETVVEQKDMQKRIARELMSDIRAGMARVA